MTNPRPITASEVKDLVEKNGITQIKISNCSVCGYPLAYVFKDGQVGFDPGCSCIRRAHGVEPRAYQDFANHYNLQTAPAYIAELDAALQREAA